MLALKYESYSDVVQWLIHARNDAFLVKVVIGLVSFGLVALLAIYIARWSR